MKLSSQERCEIINRRMYSSEGERENERGREEERQSFREWKLVGGI